MARVPHSIRTVAWWPQEGGDAPDLSGHGGSKFAGMFRTSTRTSARSKQASKCLLM